MKLWNFLIILVVLSIFYGGASYAVPGEGKAGERGNYAGEWCPMFLPNDKIIWIPCPPKQDHFPDIAMPTITLYEAVVSDDGKTACVNTPELESCWWFSNYYNWGGMAWIKRKDRTESDSWFLFGWYWCRYTGCQGKNRTYSIKSIDQNGIEMYVLKNGTPIDKITFKDDYIIIGDRFYHINSRNGVPDYMFTGNEWFAQPEYYGEYCDPTDPRPPREYPGWLWKDTLTGRIFDTWTPGGGWYYGCSIAFRFGINKKLNAFPKICSIDELDQLTLNYRSILEGNHLQKIGTSGKFGKC